MKKSILLFVLIFISVCTFSQPGKKPKSKEKPPTNKEMEDMMKEAQKALNEMSPEDKKMMDSLGIKMPDINQMKKNASGISDKQLAEAWEDENRVVPKRDDARIAAIPKNITTEKMGSYIEAVQKKIAAVLKPDVITMGNKVYAYIKASSKNNDEAGNMAMGLWIAGNTEIALYVLGKVSAQNCSHVDNTSNYAAMLSMLGAQHLAIPILNNLNARFPKNSTLLNNLGQAWFGLGEINKAEKYVDSVIRIYAYHPQANLTKAAIEEHKGNVEKAREAVKRSMQHSYTKEKEERLRKLGEKTTAKNFRLPRRTKADPLNLGSFEAPGFPSSVDECVQSEKECIEFYRQISSKHKQLEKLKKLADEKAVDGHQQRMNADFNLLKTAMANPGTTGQFVSVPMYAERAGKLLKAYTDLYQVKWQGFMKKAKAFGEGEGKALKEAYDKEMEKLRKEDDEQTGEGKPNKDFCPRYKEASDKYLKSINPKLYQFYQEGLKLQKEFINENAYWYLYIQWPDMYEASKLGFQMGWLGDLTQGKGDIEGPVYSFPFVSITQYECKKMEKEPGKIKLKEFDDIACEYKSKIDYNVIVFESNCSHSSITYNLGDATITRKQLGDEYIGSTVKLTSKAGIGGQLGPVKIEGYVGSDVTAELDKDDQVKEWGGTVTTGIEAGVGISKGPVKAGATVSEAVEVEIGSDGVGDINMVTKAEASVGVKVGPVGKSVQVGLESRTSLISGHTTQKGTGIGAVRVSE